MRYRVCIKSSTSTFTFEDKDNKLIDWYREMGSAANFIIFGPLMTRKDEVLWIREDPPTPLEEA